MSQNNEDATGGRDPYPWSRKTFFAALISLSLWIAWSRYIRFIGVFETLDWIGLAAALLPVLVFTLDVFEHRAPPPSGDWTRPITVARFARWCVIASWIPAMTMMVPTIEMRRAAREFEENFGSLNRRDRSPLNWPFRSFFPVRSDEFKVAGATWSAARHGYDRSSRLPLLLARMGAPSLTIEEWPHHDLQALPAFRGITHLGLAAPRKLDSLDGIERFPDIEDFFLSQAEVLRSLAGVSRLKNLREFSVSHSPVAGLSPVGELKNLAKLSIGGLNAQANLLPLRACPMLEELDVIWQWPTATLDGLEHLTKLRRLRLLGLPELKRLPSLERLDLLEHLQIVDCKVLNSLEGIENCRALRHLRLDDNERLRDIRALAGLSALEILEIEGCEGIDRDQLNSLLKVRGFHSRQVIGNTVVWKRARDNVAKR